MGQKLGMIIGILAIGLAVYGFTRPPALAVTNSDPGVISNLFGSSLAITDLAQSPSSDDSGKAVALNNSKNSGKSIVDMVPAQLVKANKSTVNASELANENYVLVYFSAHWCPPCRKFTPKLVKLYNEQARKGQFEVIFVSSDRNEDAMYKYMREARMPWVAVPFKDRRGALAKAYAENGIPNLLVLKPDGSVVLSTFVNGQYRGPDRVLNAFKKLLAEKKTTAAPTPQG